MPEALTAPSISQLLAQAGGLLAEAGCATPRLDAEVLLAEVLGVTRAGLVTEAHSLLADADLAHFEALLSRRAGREPVAYIIGRRDFRHISLTVDSRVLIPRPETELLVEVGLRLPSAARVADVGTGSGAVALALKHERPDLWVIGTDISTDALAVARGNAERLGLAVEFARADLLGSISCDAVLANLPYVAEGDVSLAPEIALYEPASALFAGRDGLDVIRRLIGSLEHVSLVALEVGVDQAASVAAMLERAGLRPQRLRDLAGHERVVLGRR